MSIHLHAAKVPITSFEILPKDAPGTRAERHYILEGFGNHCVLLWMHNYLLQNSSLVKNVKHFYHQRVVQEWRKKDKNVYFLRSSETWEFHIKMIADWVVWPSATHYKGLENPRCAIKEFILHGKNMHLGREKCARMFHIINTSGVLIWLDFCVLELAFTSSLLQMFTPGAIIWFDESMKWKCIRYSKMNWITISGSMT